MTLALDIRHRLGAFSLDARFETTGRLTALFGASGSGKTSLINIIGGLLKPDEGRVVAGDRVLVDTAKGLLVPAHKRRIGYVFQDARLFPHLTVQQNLAYGRWFTQPAARYADIDQIIDLLGIGHLLDRKPTGLSGGEKQRVAIGRALAASPQLILMDEPLASLDEARKAEILPYIERLRDEAKIPIVYVSHSIAEVARLADDVVVLEDGRVTAAGAVSDVMLRPDLLPRDEQAEGGAVLTMTVAAQEPDYDMTVLRSAAGEMRVPTITAPAGSQIRLRIRARDVMLALARPTGISGLNILSGSITALKPIGAQVDVTIDCSGQAIVARITRMSAEKLALKVGLQLFAVVKSVSFDRTSNAFAPASTTGQEF